MTVHDIAQQVASDLKKSNSTWTQGKVFSSDPSLAGSIASQIAISAGDEAIEFIAADTSGIADKDRLSLDVFWMTSTRVGNTSYYTDDKELQTTLVARSSLSEITVLTTTNLLPVGAQGEPAGSLSFILKYPAFEVVLPMPGASRQVKDALSGVFASLQGDLQ